MASSLSFAILSNPNFPCARHEAHDVHAYIYVPSSLCNPTLKLQHFVNLIRKCPSFREQNNNKNCAWREYTTIEICGLLRRE